MNYVVITIDGPSGSGKGTLAQRIASEFGFHYLDSGCVYRLVALHAVQSGIDFSNELALVAFITNFQLNNVKVTADKRWKLSSEGLPETRTEAIGIKASELAKYPKVRTALLDWQRSGCWSASPGLVTDGRDMGTVVFPDAVLKVFLDASCEVRAQRRYQQCLQAGDSSATLAKILNNLQQRDQRDRSRLVSPLKAADDAIVINSSESSIDEVFAQVCTLIKERGIK